VKRALEHPLKTLRAVAAVVRASLRVWWHEPRTSLPELVARLKNAPPSHIAFDVTLADAVVERLLPLLPPWGAGRCVKRSLLRLDLWSRAGRTPRLHVGLLDAELGHEGHVWVTTDGSTLEGVTETWRS